MTYTELTVLERIEHLLEEIANATNPHRGQKKGVVIPDQDFLTDAQIRLAKECGLQVGLKGGTFFVRNHRGIAIVMLKTKEKLSTWLSGYDAGRKA